MKLNFATFLRGPLTQPRFIALRIWMIIFSASFATILAYHLADVSYTKIVRVNAKILRISQSLKACQVDIDTELGQIHSAFKGKCSSASLKVGDHLNLSVTTTRISKTLSIRDPEFEARACCNG